MVTLGLAFLMGLLGLVVDLGWGYYQKQVAQTVADSAAMAAVIAAGTGSIACGTGGVVCQSATSCSSVTAGTNLAAGCQYGVQNGVAASRITMAANTTAFSGVSTDYWVTTTVSIPQSLTFLRVIGFNNATVSASATGAVVGSGGSGGGCVYTLDNTSTGPGLTLSGAGLYLSCGVYINNTSTTNAFSLSGSQASLCYGSSSGSCTAGKSAPLNMVSGAKISASGSGCKQDAFYGTQNPSNTIQCSDPSYSTPVADPLASLPAPTVGSCSPAATLGTASWNHSSTWSWSNISPAQTINPGVYCGGLNIQGGNVTLNPGIYILNGGGLTIQGSNTTVSGAGVYFYNTATSGNTAGPMTLSGQPNVTLTSPTSGTYEGIFFMQDHNVCGTSSSINGNTNIKINGSIYTHCTDTPYSPDNLTYTGESSTGYYTAIVVDKLTVNGMSNLTLDPTGGQNTGIGLGNVAKPYLIQ